MLRKHICALYQVGLSQLPSIELQLNPPVPASFRLIIGMIHSEAENTVRSPTILPNLPQEGA